MKKLMLIALLVGAPAQAMDYTGKRVASLLVVRRDVSRKWVCLCQCGNLRTMHENDLRFIKLFPESLEKCTVCLIVSKYKPKHKILARVLDAIKEED